MLIERRNSFLGRHLRLRDRKKEAREAAPPTHQNWKLSSSKNGYHKFLRKKTQISNFDERAPLDVVGEAPEACVDKSLLLSRPLLSIELPIVLALHNMCRENLERSSYLRKLCPRMGCVLTSKKLNVFDVVSTRFLHVFALSEPNSRRILDFLKARVPKKFGTTFRVFLVFWLKSMKVEFES